MIGNGDSPQGIFGIPSDFRDSTSSGGTFLFNKGQLNKLRLRPQVINEQCESSRNIIAEISNGNIVGQIFKASQDNINGIDLTLESAAITIFDDFETYADSAALQTAWNYTGAFEDEAVLNTLFTNPASSTQSMELSCDDNAGEEWEQTITSTDFVGATGSLKLYVNKEYKDVQLRFFLRDSTGNTASAPLVQDDKDVWNSIEVSAVQLSEDGAWITNTADIVGVGIRVEKEKGGGIAYIDTMVSAPAPGSVEIKLFDMGTTLPESGVSTLSDGTQYEKIGDLGISGNQTASLMLDLEGGFRSYHIDRFICGVALEMKDANEVLNPDHYYALALNWVDTDVSVYGPNPLLDNYYESGYSFTTPDGVSAMTATGEDEDLMFIIYSTQDVYVSGFLNIVDAMPNGNSMASLYIEDDNMKRTSVQITGVRPPQVVDRILGIPKLLPRGGKMEQEYNDDFTDDVTKSTFIMIYYYKRSEVNG